MANEGMPSATDSLHSQANVVADSAKAVADSIDSYNVVAVAESVDAFVISTADSVVAPSKQKKSRKRADEEYWMPDPKKAMWLSLLLPGAGQIYNRSYWKVPLIYGLGIGSFYVVSFQGRMYKEYSAAYYSLVDNDPKTRDYDPIFEGLGKVDEN
ncbi:MAG: hypothetical protein J5614_00590, partial [Paludibacteraceae bacterium]|nr:hypothetical protein [Paludibacteraceae bacterium]